MAGTISRGIKAPIIREGDDIVKIVADSVQAAAEQDSCCKIGFLWFHLPLPFDENPRKMKDFPGVL